MSLFDEAVEYLMSPQCEGGYVNDPSDPGGETKYGISKRSYPHLNIAALTQEESKEIYKKDWWDKLNLDNFPYEGVAEKLFNISVNIGIHWCVICLQRAVRASNGEQLKEDGIIGSKTLQAIKLCDESSLLCAFRSEIAGYYRSLKNQDKLNGWLNRAYR